MNPLAPAILRPSPSRTLVPPFTKSGKAISDAELKTRIRVGSPVSVDYVTDGDARIVNRVVIDD